MKIQDSFRSEGILIVALLRFRDADLLHDLQGAALRLRLGNAQLVVQVFLRGRQFRVDPFLVFFADSG